MSSYDSSNYTAYTTTSTSTSTTTVSYYYYVNSLLDSKFFHEDFPSVKAQPEEIDVNEVV